MHLNGHVDIKRVLICRPNHRLGNLLLITPLVQEITETFPEVKIDLFVKGRIAPTLFKNYPHINHIIQLPRKPLKALFKYLQGWLKMRSAHYDIVFNVVSHSNSGRLSAKLAKAKYKFAGQANADIQRRYKDHEHMAKYPVYSFWDAMCKLGIENNEKRVAPMDLKLSPSEKAEGKKILHNIVRNNKKTIALFTYATGAKCYSNLWWDDVYDQIKREYPDFNIIEILPVENVSQISFRAPSFYSKDIREIGSVIANTIVFIGADSGMMHLASSVQTPTVGLFKVTNLKGYAPYGNDSVALDTNTTDTAGLIKIVNSILKEQSFHTA
jgi:ADP-heptose:LPS heptosyltransferase